jgi:opacity protein-like surface antigen
MKKIVLGMAVAGLTLGAAAPAAAEQPDLAFTPACHGQIVATAASQLGTTPADLEQFTAAEWNSFVRTICEGISG